MKSNSKDKTMATIKSYTDLEQSKRLAEFLPLESADMYYTPSLIKGHTNYFPHLKSRFPIDWDIEQAIPCWSLTALMNFIESLGKVEINFNCNSNKYWVNVHFESMGSFCQDHELYDSKIDALIAIIKKLKSRNLL